MGRRVEERERGRDGGGCPGCGFPFPLLAWPFPWSPETQVQWPLQNLACLLLHLLSVGNTIGLVSGGIALLRSAGCSGKQRAG